MMPASCHLLRSRCERYRFVSKLVIALTIAGCALGCGGGRRHHAPTMCDTNPSTDDDGGERGERYDSGALAVTATFVSCTDVTLSVVGPNQLSMGKKATLVAHAAGLKKTTKFAFSWTASAGKLSKPAGAEIEYTCSALGPQELELTAAEDNQCTHAMTVPIACVKP